MKKTLILISGLYMGGFTKSLLNFLWCMDKHGFADKITLLVLSDKVDSLEKQVPPTIKVLHENLKYKESKKQNIIVFIYKLKYVFMEMFYKYIKREEIPVKFVREYAQAKLRAEEKKIINDFSKYNEYDVVISWSEGFCNYLMIEHFHNIYKVGYIHPNYLEAGFSKRIDNKYLKEMNRIITVSESCCDTLKSVFPKYKKKIECVPNRLNLQLYQNLAMEYVPKYDKNKINMLTVARVVDHSRAVFRMINLVERLKRDDYKFRWYLIGDGQDLSELKKQIQEKELEDYLICLGEMDNPCPYMKHANLYIQQSYYEGKPVSVDEAMMLGTPALVTNYSSAKEQVVDGKNGWIVDNNENSIYKKLKELLENPQMMERARTELSEIDNEKFENCEAMINMIRMLK